MRRIGFRRALPILFTLIHIALVWSTVPDASRSVNAYPLYQSVSYQEGVAVPMKGLEPPPLKPVQKMALILELPVMVVAMIGAAMFGQNETMWMYLSIPLVPFLWYVVGRWLDGLAGLIAPLRVPRVLRVLLTVPVIMVLGISVGGLTPLYHHRTSDSRWVFTGLVLWSGLALAIVFCDRTLKEPGESPEHLRG